MGFFDLANRYDGLDAKNDPLTKINAVVVWEDFRAALEAVWRKPAASRKSRAGRKAWDAVMMFKAIILCTLYNLSDNQVEYQIRDRLSFMRFLGLGLESRNHSLSSRALSARSSQGINSRSRKKT